MKVNPSLHYDFIKFIIMVQVSSLRRLMKATSSLKTSGSLKEFSGPRLQFGVAKVFYSARPQDAPAQEQVTSDGFNWTINQSRTNYDRISGGHNGRDREHVDNARREGFGPLNAMDETIKAKLEEDASRPADVLRQSIQDGTASAHVVSLCLAAQHRLLESIPKLERSEKSNGIAAAALKYIWRDEKIWGPIVCSAYQTQYYLCYFAILEGLEDYIFEWVTANVSGAKAPRSTQPGRYVWRGILLRSFLMAKLYHDPTNDASSAMMYFFKAAEFREDYASARHNREPAALNAAQLSLIPAYLAIQRAITSGPSHIRDRSLFDDFLKFQETFPVMRKGDRAFDRARSLLYYPERPIETDAVKILRKFKRFGNSIPKSVLSTQGALSFNTFLQRTVDVANSNGNAVDASWVLENFKERLRPSDSRFARTTKYDQRHLVRGPSPDVQSG